MDERPYCAACGEFACPSLFLPACAAPVNVQCAGGVVSQRQYQPVLGDDPSLKHMDGSLVLRRA